MLQPESQPYIVSLNPALGLGLGRGLGLGLSPDGPSICFSAVMALRAQALRPIP
jgi:hypothetical protein